MLKWFQLKLQSSQKVLYRFMKNDGISIVISLIVVIIFSVFLIDSNSIFDWIDFSILSSVVIALIISSISNAIEKVIVNRIEDSNKLTQDYDNLSKLYESKLLTYNNSNTKGINELNFTKLLRLEGKSIRTYHSESLESVFPISDYTYTYNKTINLHDSKVQYKLPDDIKNNYESLLNAHRGSTKYNQMAIRIDKWVVTDEHFNLFTSRTTYFDSLVTNRAMDYEWSNGLTNRKIFEYGPFITPLAASCMSNNIGFNGFVETKKGYIPFIQRSEKVSTAKKVYAMGVTASLKSKYVLNDNLDFTIKGFKKGIVNEIIDELKINEDELIWHDLKNHLIYFYRDVVEGGKPQFIFHVKTKRTKEEITTRFKEQLRQKKKWYNQIKQPLNASEEMLEDGSKLLWIHKDELKTIAITPGYFIYNNKKYKSTPSYTSSMVMLIKHLDNTGEI